MQIIVHRAGPCFQNQVILLISGDGKDTPALLMSVRGQLVYEVYKPRCSDTEDGGDAYTTDKDEKNRLSK
jgi:hypothetical protein